MRWKTTAVLAVLLVGLATFFYVYDVKQAPEREKSAAEKDRVWKGLESKDIEEVAITRKGATLQLKKSGDAWSLASPVQGRAESQPVQDMLGSLASLRVEREIEPRPSKPADFGLETPAAEISFTAKGAKHRVRLGTKNPTGLWVYAQLDDKPAVVLVPDSLLRDAEKPVADFRDRTVLTFEKKDVKGLEVRTPGGQQVAAQLKGPEDWQVTSPLPVKADREQVSGLLDKLKAVKIKEFVTEAPKGPDPYGLDRPLALTLWLGEEKERSAKTLRLGKAVPEKKAIYAQREGDPTVFTVEEDLLKAVPTSSTALRERPCSPTTGASSSASSWKARRARSPWPWMRESGRSPRPPRSRPTRGGQRPALQGAGPPGQGVRGRGRKDARALGARPPADPALGLGEGREGAEEPPRRSGQGEGPGLRGRRRSRGPRRRHGAGRPQPLAPGPARPRALRRPRRPRRHPRVDPAEGGDAGPRAEGRGGLAARRPAPGKARGGR
jgi:hypothetical protein